MAATTTTTTTKMISMEEASTHNTLEDCWVVIHGKVYDVSKYLSDHPGGEDVILEATGKDATDEFEDAGHSETARSEMEDYLIGKLGTASPSTKKLGDLTKQYAVPMAVTVIGISVVVGFLYMRKK
ncbi:hypothetical protein ACFE04_015785 [Oxalis oulophora]